MPASRAIRSSSDGQAYRNSPDPYPTAPRRVVVGDEPLRQDVVLVEAEMLRRHVEGHEALSRRQPAQLGDEELDDEAAARLEVRCRVRERRHLAVLRRDIAQRVPHEVDERERAVDRGRRVVAERGRDRAARLPCSCSSTVGRDVDAVHAHAALRERQRDPSAADGELERAAGSHRSEEVDGRTDDLRARTSDPSRPSSRPLQLPVLLRVPLADLEHREPDRDRERADHEQRPHVGPRETRRRSGSAPGCRAARTSPARSSRPTASSPAARSPGSRRPTRRASGPARRSRAAFPSPARRAAGPRSSSRRR